MDEHTHAAIQCQYCLVLINTCCDTDIPLARAIKLSTCNVCLLALRKIIGTVSASIVARSEATPPEIGEKISVQETQGKTCCALRRKILVTIKTILPEDVCGIPESAVADVLRFDISSPSGAPVVAFRFCPWCGVRRTDDTERRVTDTTK